MLKKRFKWKGEDSIEKIEDIVTNIFSIALLVTLFVFIYSSFPVL